MIIIDDEGNTIGYSWFPEKTSLVQRTISFRSPVAHPAAMFRTAPVVQLGGYRQEYAPAEDYDLWSRLMEFGHIANLPRFVLMYRRHEGQISQQSKIMQSEKYSLISSRRATLVSDKNPKNANKPEILRRVKFDQTLHNFASNKLSRRWLSLPFDFLRTMSIDPKATTVFTLLYMYGRWRLRNLRKASHM